MKSDRNLIIIISILGRVLAFIAILAFVLCIIYLTNNLKYLWLLFLLITVEFIPVYEARRKLISRDDAEKDREE